MSAALFLSKISEYAVILTERKKEMKYLIKKPDTFLSMLNDDITSVLHRSFDNLFPEYVFEREMKGMAMPVDVKEFEDKYELRVEIPGVKKENINLDINKNTVKIEASKNEEICENDKKKKYHKSEFRYGNYSRTLYFPVDIDSEHCDAELKHGILKIELPKKEAEKVSGKKIEIKE